MHQWHGNLPSRKHADRKKILENFDPNRDLHTNSDGAFEWSPRADRSMIAQVANYFEQRVKDEVLP